MFLSMYSTHIYDLSILFISMNMIKWIASMFCWAESLQSYNVGGWNYIDDLKQYVDSGMRDNSFIDAVSAIVNRG